MSTNECSISQIAMSNPQQLVQKLWNYCNLLRDDGLSRIAQKNDRPGCSCERTPWVLVTGAEPLK